MQALNSLLSKTLLAFSVLALACHATQTATIFTDLQQKCNFMQGAADVHDWKTVSYKNMGAYGDYYTTDIPQGQYKNAYPPGLMIRCLKIDEFTPELVETTQKMSDLKVGANFKGCQVKENPTGEFKICLVFDKTKSIAQDFANWNIQKATQFKAGLLAFMKLIKTVNDNGYYFNNFRKATVTLDLKNDIRLVDTCFMVPKNGQSKTKKPLDQVWGLDAPSLFQPDSPYVGNEDFYSGSMLFAHAVLDKTLKEYITIPKAQTVGKTAEKDCTGIRDTECNKWISVSLADALLKNQWFLGGGKQTYLDSYITNSYKLFSKTSATTNIPVMFYNLNVVTLLRDFWAYEACPLNGDQFISLLEEAVKHRILI